MCKPGSDKERKERYCMDALYERLTNHDETCTNIHHRKCGEDPPDFTACINGKKCAIEVTEFIGLGNVDGNEQSMSETNTWCDVIEKKIQDRIRQLNAKPAKYGITLVPMKNGEKQDRVIEKLAHLIADAPSAKDSFGRAVLYRTNNDQLFCERFPINNPPGNFSYDHEWWQIVHVQNHEIPVVEIVRWSYDSDSIGERVDAQLKPDDIRLEKLISDKNSKLNKIKDKTIREYPRILVIHSTLDGPSRLQRVWKCKESVAHKKACLFHRIFLVHDNVKYFSHI